MRKSTASIQRAHKETRSRGASLATGYSHSRRLCLASRNRLSPHRPKSCRRHSRSTGPSGLPSPSRRSIWRAQAHGDYDSGDNTCQDDACNGQPARSMAPIMRYYPSGSVAWVPLFLRGILSRLTSWVEHLIRCVLMDAASGPASQYAMESHPSRIGAADE